MSYLAFGTSKYGVYFTETSLYNYFYYQNYDENKFDLLNLMFSEIKSTISNDAALMNEFEGHFHIYEYVFASVSTIGLLN